MEPKSVEDWRLFHEIIAVEGVKKPYQFVIGNHDWPIPDLPDALPGFPKAGYYSFTVGKTLWIVLNTNKSIAADAEQGRFLHETLLLGKEKGFIPILVTHHPIYSAGPHGQESIVSRVRNFLLPFIREFHIPLVISGHDHAYQKLRMDNTLYLTTAGGGASTYPRKYELEGLDCFFPVHHSVLRAIDEKGIQGTAYNIDHRMIDTFFFSFK